MKHIVVFTDGQIEKLLDGKLKYDIRFFKKKPKFLQKLAVGDIIFFRKSRGEILGQFKIGKIIIIERVENRDWEIVEERTGPKNGLSKERFEELANKNSILLIVRIDKLEQLITSPVEIDKRSKKEWIVLGENG